MTPYAPAELADYEFKILRSSMGIFKNRARLEAVLAEEAKAGWELVEKFDSQRLRLKRRIAWRGKDANLDFDPYRTVVGVSEAMLATMIVGAISGVTLMLLLISAMLR